MWLASHLLNALLHSLLCSSSHYPPPLLVKLLIVPSSSLVVFVVLVNCCSHCSRWALITQMWCLGMQLMLILTGLGCTLLACTHGCCLPSQLLWLNGWQGMLLNEEVEDKTLLRAHLYELNDRAMSAYKRTLPRSTPHVTWDKAYILRPHTCMKTHVTNTNFANPLAQT